jgi:hypothetical protein
MVRSSNLSNARLSEPSSVAVQRAACAHIIPIWHDEKLPGLQKETQP